MTPADVWTWAESLPQATASFPFDEHTLVLKVAGEKMFCVVPLDRAENEPQMVLKFEPERLDDLREEYPCFVPASHFNKMHWSAVLLDGSVSAPLLQRWMVDSYNLVLSGMTKRRVAELGLAPLPFPPVRG